MTFVMFLKSTYPKIRLNWLRTRSNESSNWWRYRVPYHYDLRSSPLLSVLIPRKLMCLLLPEFSTAVSGLTERPFTRSTSNGESFWNFDKGRITKDRDKKVEQVTSGSTLICTWITSHVVVVCKIKSKETKAWLLEWKIK